jgi:ureidoglycolate lyase
MSAMHVSLEPLVAEAFAPFGDVATRPTGVRRRYLPTSLDHAADASTMSLWISRVSATASLPLQLTALERHPFSAQSFIPLDSGRYLVVVCETDAKGRPNLRTLRAFVAGSQQAVTYARNVWHHPMTVLDHPMDFAVAMGVTGREDDDEWHTLDSGVTVVMPPAAAWRPPR